MSIVFNPFTGNFDEVSDLSVTAVGSTPNANASTVTEAGTSISLTLQPADGTNPGVLTAGTQTIGGNKTFTGTIAASNFSGSSSGINTGDVTIGTANGLSITGQVLSLALATGSTPGAVLNIGSANGVATLDSSGKIPVGQLPSVVMEYQGAWNPNTNTPTLSDGTGTNGFVYYVTALRAAAVAGLTDPSMVNFQIGDLIIYSSSVGKWQLVTPAAGVSSVNGAQGAVIVNAINQLTGDATAGPASGSQSQALTLATVNANVGTFTYATVTVNAKGLVTAASSGAAPTGTVTSVSVVSANGLAGTVATATTTPAITLSTTITGILQGNGTAISAASTTGTGSVVLATSPTLVTPALGTPTALVLTNATGLPLTTGVTGILPIANGGTNVSSVTVSPTATAFAGWDANKNLSANNHIQGYTTTATAAGTTILTVASTYEQYFTGVTTQTVTLPVATTLVNGQSFLIVNNSTGSVTVQTSGANTLIVLPGSTAAIVTVINTAGGTGTASWDAKFLGAGGAVTPTIQKFISGTAATYTTPANVVYIKVKMVGGGGGGAASANSSGTTATSGGNSSFAGSGVTLTANGGIFANFNAPVGGGGGGTASITGAVGTAITGGQGFGNSSNGGSTSFTQGGAGGANPLGGGGSAGAAASAGGSGATNTGAGGGGAGGSSTSGVGSGSGGGAGGFIEAIVNSPASTYTYTVGAGGVGEGASGGGLAGGNGATGYIEVTEYYANGAIGTATTITGTITAANVSTATFTAPTVQKFTSGTAATYTLPTSPRAPLYIRVQLIGGGGGAAGGGSGGLDGSTGTATTFSTISAGAGHGSTTGTFQGAVGGTFSGADYGRNGDTSAGNVGNATPSVTNNYGLSGAGPGGQGGTNSGGAGQGALANSGGGGGGAGGTATVQGWPGGGAGAYAEKVITSPASTYTYTVGAGGAGGGAGTGGGAGGAGGSGMIVVTEYYQ